MNITKENIDALNAVVKVEITSKDYKDKVAEILQDYRKKANIPGFRKGHVPMGLVKKQYEKSVMIDEVNKLLQDSLNKFLVEEKLDILGNPLPKMQEDFSWDAVDYAFEFELGLSPEFDVKLDTKKKITDYKIIADKTLIDKEVANIRARFGKIISKDKAEKGTMLVGTFTNADTALEKKSTISFDDLTKKSQKIVTGKKAGETVAFKSKNLFEDTHKLMGALGLSHDEIHDLDITVDFLIEEINATELAAINQELFDKVFGKDKVKDEKELRKLIKEDAEKQFATQADQSLLNNITEYLVEKTTFDLPAEFLKKWLAVSGENPMTPDQASEEFERSEKGLRYQLIEGKIIKDNDLQIKIEELKEYAKGFIKAQMAQYGNLNPEEKELDDIANRVLQNQDESKRLADQLMSKKLLDFYKQNMTFKTKELTYEAFVKEVYK